MALMAVMAGVFLALETLTHLWSWVLLRFITGWAIAAIYATVEGWLAESAEPINLGRLFSTYVIVTLVGIGAGQMLLGVLPAQHLFTAGAVLMLLGVIPVGLFCPERTLDIPDSRFDWQAIRKISPVATLGVAITGMITGCIWTLAPLMGDSRGLSYAEIALMMNAIVLGGVLFQYAFGALSDIWNRRSTIALICIAGMTVSITGWILPTLPTHFFLALMLCYGGCALSLYGVCASEGQSTTRLTRVETASTLLLVHGLGSVFGPLLAGLTSSFTNQPVLLVSATAFSALCLSAVAIQPKTSAEVLPLEKPKTIDAESLQEAA